MKSYKQQTYDELENWLGNESYRVKNGKKCKEEKLGFWKHSDDERYQWALNGLKNAIQTGHESRRFIEQGRKLGNEYGKKNIKHCRTKTAVQKQKESASYIVEQLSLDGRHVKFWNGIKSFDDSEFNYKTIKIHIENNTPYMNYLWKFEKTSNKKHKKSEWTCEKIKEVALLCSYKYEFKTKYQQAYHIAKKLNIFNDVTSHMKRPKAKNQYTK
jgi:hypothetical protein